MTKGEKGKVFSGKPKTRIILHRLTDFRQSNNHFLKSERKVGARTSLSALSPKGDEKFSISLQYEQSRSVFIAGAIWRTGMSALRL
ncbi:MAG: hypothetical protein M3Q99_01015 [Acidobacteriota bacterium]|nr:hypothetical protein [Acidobacteriota bacterium]